MVKLVKAAAIGVEGVSKKFGDFVALDDVSVSIAQNEFFTLLGPSGCGKTTLLRLIAGFDFPTAGAIYLNGSDIAALPPYKRPVNTVFQSYALFPHMTVAQNIGFGLQMLGQSKAEISARVAEMLALVQMEALGERLTSQISGGQQQRVALARALAPRPQVLLLDEPLSALDAKLRKDMQIELKRMQAATGITFIFVTHDQEEALTMSDRIAVMNKGKILQVGNPQEIYNAPANKFVAQFVGESNFLQGSLSKTGKFKQGAGTTYMVRPEQALLTTAAKGDFECVVENLIFFGTDTHVHLRLADNTYFVLRQQNAGASLPKQGAKVGVQVTSAIKVAD